jgi:hypothetical protein
VTTSEGGGAIPREQRTRADSGGVGWHLGLLLTPPLVPDVLHSPREPLKPYTPPADLGGTGPLGPSPVV